MEIVRQILKVYMESTNAEKNYNSKCKFTSRFTYPIAVGSLWLYGQIKGQIPEKKKNKP